MRKQGASGRCCIQRCAKRKLKALNKSIFQFVISPNRVHLSGEDDRIFNLHLLMAFNFIIYCTGISNLRKPAFTATCALSVFYANLAANDVRRMNNGAFNAMTDEEEQ
ncbi:hypothetical protein T03_17266 [Trichinella britovi]|uniref:Uncharacterized protein n=1 Tax=Trichinella britovi TaxID=45882 RepID=A0A0V1D4W7_TRIBR|nr:hypothetical protein T03_17266 [Trichinella britovi]